VPQIQKFDMGWSLKTKRGLIRIQVAPGAPFIQFKDLSAEEFTALALLLQEKPVFIDANSTIHTGEQNPGN
jgi:hypothetical protein